MWVKIHWDVIRSWHCTLHGHGVGYPFNPPVWPALDLAVFHGVGLVYSKLSDLGWRVMVMTNWTTQTFFTCLLQWNRHGLRLLFWFSTSYTVDAQNCKHLATHSCTVGNEKMNTLHCYTLFQHILLHIVLHYHTSYRNICCLWRLCVLVLSFRCVTLSCLVLGKLFLFRKCILYYFVFCIIFYYFVVV